ncbi:hypothetical protein IDJ77_05455 [Mucilaginibacter sp. ZT4R22]|uniref:Uncharacterized protein n=1 Tax=Mucilaginibacter pankratovii TaxID=2772110 RepID=A0ABR7WLQ0_9SPHI|nr:hypothetical protein [Mucilaginibacter pankratovii]MBD1363253.1 hypothetical protein [Mucilaginibacter pankratovii]
MSTTPTNNDNPDGTIPLETAKAWAANWRSHLSTSEDEFQGRSFFIPTASINTLLANSPNAEGVRAYIGMEDETDPLTAKLVIVSVVNGEEVLTIPGENGGEDRPGTVDLVTACPPVCPTGGGPTIES